MPTRTVTFLAFACVLIGAGTAHADRAAALDLPWVLEQVRLGNADVKAANADAAAAGQRVLSTRSLPDPEVGVEFWGIARPGLDLGSSDQRWLDFSQEIPFPGKTLLQSSVAEHEVHLKEAEAEKALQAKLFEAKQAYWDLYTAVASLRVVTQTQTSLQDLIHLSRQRVQLSQGGRAEQLMEPMARMQGVTLDNQAISLGRERLEAKARLRRLMGADSNVALPDPSLDLVPRHIGIDKADVLSRALNGSPDMMEAVHHLLHMQAQRKLALAGWMPDLMLQYSLVDTTGGPQSGMAMAKVSLPFLWFWRQGAEVASADKDVEASAAMLQGTRQETEEMVEDEVAAAKSLQAQWKNDQTRVLPEAAKALALGVSGYRAGSIGVSDALGAVQAFLMANLETIALRAQIERSMAGLEQLVGGSLQGPTMNDQEEMHHENP